MMLMEIGRQEKGKGSRDSAFGRKDELRQLKEQPVNWVKNV